MAPNQYFRKSTWLTLAASLALAAACPSCSHKPVYPDYGSAQITSVPSVAEIVIDGQSTQRTTPCKIDGVTVGTHTLTLRKQWYRVLACPITIKPGETHRQNVHLAPVAISLASYGTGGNSDFTYDAAHQRLYVAAMWSTVCSVYDVRDSVVTHLYNIEVGASQRLIAVSPAANRLFCLLDDSTMALVDLNSPTVIRRLALPGMSGYRSLEVSPDGNMVMAADSVNKRLVLIDARLGSVIKYIGLPASPSDAVFGPAGADAYVTLPQQRRMVRVDLASGAVVVSLPAGNAPGDLFWDLDQANIGWCNRSDMSITMASLANWSETTGRFNVGGGTINGACFTAEPAYVLVIVGDVLDYCYLPTWELGETGVRNVKKMIHSPTDRRRYYILCYGSVAVLTGDF